MEKLKSLEEFRLNPENQWTTQGGVGTGGGQCTGTATEHKTWTGYAAQAFNVLNDTAGDWSDENCCK